MADKNRIALFLDGTWNNVSDNTNVWRLKSLCATVGIEVEMWNAVSYVGTPVTLAPISAGVTTTAQRR